MLSISTLINKLACSKGLLKGTAIRYTLYSGRRIYCTMLAYVYKSWASKFGGGDLISSLSVCQYKTHVL